jgi:hypothetical protein
MRSTTPFLKSNLRSERNRNRLAVFHRLPRRRLDGGQFSPLMPIMPLHLLKLCVGAESIRDLEDWIQERVAQKRRRGELAEHHHTTRMVPKRRAALIGGSLYWVIKGQIAARQVLQDVRPFTDADGIGRCHLILDPRVVTVMPRPCRPFQGWRYLSAGDAPKDIGVGGDDVALMPEGLRRELRYLGLI